MPRKRTKERKGPASDEALIVWLMDKPYLIMKALNEGSENATSIASALCRKPIAWVSKRTGKMAELGLITKEEADDHGFCRMRLTKKGVEVLHAIDDINSNPMFIELKRAMELTAPGEDNRLTIRNEAARINEVLTSNDIDKCDISSLFGMVLDASSAKVEGWYACKDMKGLFSTVQSGRWDERSRLLLIKIIGRAINDSRTDREYVTAFNGLVGPLRQLALDAKASIDIRIESIMTIGSFRDHDGKVSDSALEAVMQIQWKMLSPKFVGFNLMEDAISEVLRKWAPLMSDRQKEMLFRSVDRARYGNMPTLDDLTGKCKNGRHRKVKGIKLESYRSLVSSMLGRDIPRTHA
jgi:hypothetical protein